MWHIIPDSFRTHWKDWEVRFLVLFSLLLQMVLIPTGTHRKATQRIYIQFLVWSAYLTAESVPILTLGVISNWLSNLKNQTTTGVLERKHELMALWAPFLLVHLGGPDSITAYALEDNELWLRHLVKVSIQIGWTLYIYFLALSSSPLSYLAFAVIVIGALKNFERSLSLFRASKDEFRDLFTSRPRSSLLYPRLTGNLSLKMKEGHIVSLDSTTEIQAPEALSLPKYRHLEKPQDRNVYIAHQLLKTFEVLFADLIVNLKSLEIIKFVIREMTSENAFKIIDIELNLMFEFLYTKARIIYGPFGIISKTITMVLTLGVVLSFCMVDKQVYELKLDVSITFMVILGLLLSEIYSIIKVISSDRLYALFIERKSSFMYRLVSYMQSCQELGWLGFATEGCKWSATLSQFNILGFAVDKTWKLFSYNQIIYKLYEKIKQYFSIFYRPLGDDMRIWIHMYLKGKVQNLDEEGPWLPAYGATKILFKSSLHQLTWSTDEIEFSRSIVIWHIATEIQYNVDRKLFEKRMIFWPIVR